MRRNWIALATATALLGVARGEIEEIYLDAQDGGRHAVIQAALEGQEGRESLILRIRPHGQGVEREGGWRSRTGFNAHTARELESVLRARGFEARFRGRDGVVRPVAVAWEKTFATFPRRRLRADWSIDYLARTEPLVSELSLQTTGPLAGTETLELLARGEARLLVEYEVASGTILRLGMPGHSPTVPVALLIAEQAAVEPLALPEGWAARTVEDKWKWYEQVVGDEVERRGRLVAALAKAKDWKFLEEIALYSAGAYGTHSIGVVLHGAKAPNWRRVTVWFANSAGGHGAVHTSSLLAAVGEKGKSLGWLNKYPERLDPSLKALQKQWTDAGIKPEKPEGDLPPLVEDEVFGGIGEAFKERAGKLAEGKIALITRGIRGWAVSLRWGSPWGEKVVDLIEDPEWRIAEAACLAFTGGRNQAVPMAPLWEVATDEKKDQRLREAAFLGWSYGNWAEVFKVLHEVGGQADHALWKPAVSRLGEMGNGWSIVMLEGLENPKGRKGKRVRLEPEQKKLVKQEVGILREQRGKRKLLSRDFETTAWATAMGFNRSADMEEWLLEHYGTAEFATEESRQALSAPRGWSGRNQPPELVKERLEVRQRLLDELEFRWEKSKK